MQGTNDLNALNGLEGPFKDKALGASDRARLGNLRNYLRALPSLDFSQKGRANICCRFNCDESELAAAVASLQSPRPNAPTPELLHAIGAAVGHQQPTRKGVTLW